MAITEIIKQRIIKFDVNPNGVNVGEEGQIGYFNNNKYKCDGGSVWYEDIIEVESIIALENVNDFKVGETIQVKSYYGDDNGGGGLFKKISVGGNPVDDNGGTIIIATNLDRWERLLDNPREIDIKMFGAKDGVKFSNKKDIHVSENPIGIVDDCTDAINRLITWFDRDRVVFPASSTEFNIQPNKILVNGHYLIDPTGLDEAVDVAITIPNGISIECVGQSSFHTNYSGINILLNEQYGIDSSVKIYRRLWEGIHTANWYVKNLDSVADDLYSSGVVLSSSRRCTLYVEATGFVHGVRITDYEVVGCVDNSITLGKLLNNRYGISVTPEGGGWSNQNTYTGGDIKITGYFNRSTTIKTPCSAIELNGNNNVFINTNLEGSSNYQYTINDNQGENVFINIRFENSTFAGQLNMENEGNVFIGGNGNTPTANGIVSAYENIDGTLDLTKRGYTANLAHQLSNIGGGQMVLTGAGTSATLPISVLSLRTTSVSERYLQIGKSHFRLRHLIHSEGEDAFCEFHTGTNEYVDMKKLHQDWGIYNLITHSTGDLAGVGDWIDDTATSGNWYLANKVYEMGIDVATDVANGDLELEPPSSLPVLFKNKKILTPDIVGLDADFNETSLLTSLGTFDNHVWNDADSYITLSADVVSLDLTGKSPTLFFYNSDGAGTTPVEHSISFDKTALTAMRGATFLLENKALVSVSQPLDSSPIKFVNNSSGVISQTGSDIILNAGEWVLVRIIRDLNNTVAFTEITRSNKKQYNIIDSGAQASLPTSPVITETYFHTDLNTEVQYNGTIWVNNGYQVIGTTAQRPTGVYRGYKYYDTTTVSVVTNDGTDTWT